MQLGIIGIQLTTRPDGKVSYLASIGVGKLGSVQVNGIIDTEAWLKACNSGPCPLIKRTRQRHKYVEDILRAHLPGALD